MHENIMHQITHMHFDFTTPEALRSLQAMKRKERRAQEKEDKRVEEKPDWHPFNFYIVSFGDK